MHEMGVRRWLKNVVNSRALDAEFNDEIGFHLEMRTDSHMREGMTEEDAVALAEKQFGDIDGIERAMLGARMPPLYALSAGLMGLVIVVVGLWLYDSSRSSELPTLPQGMKFVGGPPAP